MHGLHDRRIVLHNLDGSHIGPAVTWWEAALAVCDRPDQASTRGAAHGPAHGMDAARTIARLRATLPAEQMLRSVVDLLLSLGEWVARNDHGSRNDAGIRLFESFADNPLVLPSQRILCDDLAAALRRDPACAAVTMHLIEVGTAVSLLVLISKAIENRFGVRTVDQVETYRRATLLAQAAFAY